LGRVKVTLFPCVIGTKLDVGPVIPWTTLMIICMSPVDVITPLVFSKTGEGYHVNLACFAIHSIKEKIEKKSLGRYFWLY
jgi:hypothetical protein